MSNLSLAETVSKLADIEKLAIGLQQMFTSQEIPDFARPMLIKKAIHIELWAEDMRKELVEKCTQNAHGPFGQKKDLSV